MRRSKFALGICLLLTAAVGLSGLSSCGGGGSRPVTKPGDEVIITPPENRAPVVSRAFENIVLPFAPRSEWESEPLANYFSDPDDDTLRFSVNTDSLQVASVELSDTEFLIVRAQGSGTATITVTATDPDGLSTAQSFRVATTLDNRPPTTVRTFADIALTLSDDDPSLGRWASGYLDSYFSDPESERLSYEWQSSDESIAVVRVDDSLLPPARTSAGTPLGLVVDAKGAGITQVSVTARDPHGATTSQRFSIVVADSRGVVGPPSDDHSDMATSAGRIASGETIRGDLHSPDDEDWFRLEITEPSAVDIQLLAVPGTEVSVLDMDGNVLASRVAPGLAHTSTRALGGLVSPQGEPLVSPRGGPLAVVVIGGLVVYRTVIVVVRATPRLKPLLSRAAPYALGASYAAITLSIIQTVKHVSVNVKAGTKFSQNLVQYFSCLAEREDNNAEVNLDESCHLEIEAVDRASISVNGAEVASFRLEGNLLVGNAGCKAIGESEEIALVVKADLRIFGFKVKEVRKSEKISLNIDKSDEKKCLPQERTDRPELSVTASPGQSLSIRLTDYIWDPRDGRLTFTRKGTPPKVTVDDNGSSWTIRISPDAELGEEHSMTITATSRKDETPEILSADFTFRISVGCEAQAEFNIAGRYYIHLPSLRIYNPSDFNMNEFARTEYTYTGSCQNGRASGQGRFSASKTSGQSLHYDGQWVDGEPSGEGNWRISNTGLGIFLYEGESRNGQPHGGGTARIQYNDGSDWRYEGDWIAGKQHGKGEAKIEFHDGGTWRYEGDWAGGEPHGRGTYSSSSSGGDRGHYEGEFRNGLQHGRGVETNTYANGDRERLEGEFRNDVIWRGTATWNGVSCPVIDGDWDC